MPCSASRCGGRGPRKSQNKQADREAGESDVVKHDAEAGGDQPAVSSTIDGRITCSAAITSAAMPKTELRNR